MKQIYDETKEIFLQTDNTFVTLISVFCKGAFYKNKRASSCVIDFEGGITG